MPKLRIRAKKDRPLFYFSKKHYFRVARDIQLFITAGYVLLKLYFTLIHLYHFVVLYKVKLKNADDNVLLDDITYEYLTTEPYLVKIDLVNNLRKHSSGCAVFQKTWKKADGGYKTETIYLHKLIAEQFLTKYKTDSRNLVGTKNGNKLDCRLHNIVYRSRSVSSRKRKSSSKVGYTGVYQENNRYRAVISINRKSVHLGMFDTAEEAAMAYNRKSRELYGEDGKINIIKPQKDERGVGGHQNGMPVEPKKVSTKS
jgi:hypothetical protein